MTTSDRYDALLVRARVGEPIVIDGATGSECFRRGIPRHELGWSGGAALSHPDIVRSIHADYLDIGADMVVSNTFAAGANILRDVGTEGDFEELNRTAIELVVAARNASAADASIAGGGISNWSFSGVRPSLEQLEDDTRRQALVMRDAGAEFLSLEMMVDLPQLRATLNGAASVGLPVWVGFSIGPELGHDPSELDDPIQLRDGDSLIEAVELAASYSEVDALCIMHTDVRLIAPCLAAVRQRWDGPLGAYAHAFAVVDGVVTHDGVISPDEYAAYLPLWQAAGATMLGGCCGIGPDHLRKLVSVIR